MLKCSAFIATSVDGYIATPTGGVEWLENAGNIDSGDREPAGDAGFNAFMESVDCMIMGRKSMEKLASFNLSPEQWPYGDIPVFALSGTVKMPPDSLKGRVEIVSGDLYALTRRLAAEGHERAYIDGGTTITSFINHDLLDEICVTQVPLLLGDGIPLFGSIDKRVKLEQARVTVYANDFVQWTYHVCRNGS